jgi:hypothetical protein
MRILLVQTASPKRVRAKAEEILAGGVYENPELTILCAAEPKTRDLFGDLPAEVVGIDSKTRKDVAARIRAARFELVYVFWTGERQYRATKLLALRLGQKQTYVDIGDGGVFRLTAKALVRFWIFRARRRLPSDHYIYVAQPERPSQPARHPGEHVLVIQSAEPLHLLRTLDSFAQKPLFRNARYTLFCRNRPEVVKQLGAHPLLHEIITHSETRGACAHLLALRRRRFDAVVFFLTGDPSYWKIKWFALLLGTRHKVAVNENNDCFYFGLAAALSLMGHRAGERSRMGVQARWTQQLQIPAFLIVKLVVFPFRFLWLLVIWFCRRLEAASAVSER